MMRHFLPHHYNIISHITKIPCFPPLSTQNYAAGAWRVVGRRGAAAKRAEMPGPFFAPGALNQRSGARLQPPAALRHRKRPDFI